MKIFIQLSKIKLKKWAYLVWDIVESREEKKILLLQEKLHTWAGVICGKPDIICHSVQEITCFSGETVAVWCHLNWTWHFIKLVFEQTRGFIAWLWWMRGKLRLGMRWAPCTAPIFTPWDCVGATAVGQLLPKDTLAEWGESTEDVIAQPPAGSFSIHCVI